MKLNKLFLVGTALFAMTACVDNDDKSEWNKGDQAITFNASIQGLTTSRATGTQWATGDRIGVYMKATGAALTAATDANKQYTVSETGAMSASSANDALYFPTDKSAVDFIAYYPYLSTLADNTYKVDVADQTNQPGIDLLYSNNATNVTSGTPALTFTHQLSQIVLNLTKDNTIASLNGLTVKFTGMNTKADFTLADGKLANAGTPADINALVKDNQAAVIALPAEALSEVKVVFELNGTTFTADYPQSKLEAGKKYVHKVLLKDSQGKPTVEFGTATITDWTEVAGGDINVDFGNGGTTPDPGTDPSDPSTGTETTIFEETFGESVEKNGNYWPSIYDMDKWSNTSGMTFKDPLVEANGWSFSNCSVRSTSALDPHVWFAANKESSMVISGFTTTGYKSLKLSYKIASNTAGADQKCIVVKAGDTELTVPSVTMTTANKYQEVELTGISASISSITFYSGSSANTAGIRIDDVKLIGIK